MAKLRNKVQSKEGKRKNVSCKRKKAHFPNRKCAFSLNYSKDLFKKIRDTKGTFHANMGTIKERNGKDLTEAEDTKRWQEYTEELYNKGLNKPDNHSDVVTHLEPDILEIGRAHV